MPRTFTRRAAVAIAAATVLLTSACGQGSSGPATKVVTIDDIKPGTKVEITWWHGQTADAAKLLGGLAREYEKAHPGVTIKDSAGASTTDELLTKLQAGFASDTYPDISYAYGSWVAKLGSSGRALDVKPLIDANPKAWEEFPEAARQTASVDGRVVGLPAVNGNLAVIYNRDLLKAAGLPDPSPDWTWDDFRDYAKKLNNPAKKISGTAYSVAGNEDTTWHLWPQLWQNGGDVLDADGKPVFNSDAGVKALDYWRTLAQEDKSVYLDQNGEKYGQMFNAGSIGMEITGPWVLYDLKQIKMNYGVQVLPGTDGDHQTVGGFDIWTLFDHKDKNKAAVAYDFTKWLTDSAQDVRWNVANGNLPLRSSTGDTPEFKQYVKDFPGADVFFANMQNAKKPRPTVPGYQAMSVEVGKAISQVLLGAKDAKTALDEAAAASVTELAN